MPDSYYTEKLLGLQEASIKKVNDMKENHEIFIEQPRKQCLCPACGKVTDKVHDYRTQRIKELSAFEKPVVLVLRKRPVRLLLRNAYGVRNFSRFRNRILFMFSGKSGAEA